LDVAPFCFSSWKELKDLRAECTTEGEDLNRNDL